jgi:hypothetical protein
MKLRAVAFLLDLLLGSGRASGAMLDAITPRPNDAYFQSFTSRCMGLVYPAGSPRGEGPHGE